MTHLTPFAESIFQRTYAITPNETWDDCAARVAHAVAMTPEQERDFYTMIRDRVFIPGGRYLYTSGREIFTNSNCYGLVVDDSRESWSKLLHDVTMCLSTGGGLGVNYSACRPNGAPIKRMGGTASGPIALMQMVNEVARHVMAGGKRRSALWAGLDWQHQDVGTFITAKDWHPDIMAVKAKHYDYPAPLDMTNISVIIDDAYLAALRAGDPTTTALHRTICDRMLKTGEPAFRNQSRILLDDITAVTGNACQESTLADRDTCNLGSIVLGRVRSLDDLERVTRLAIQFLYNGSVKATYPTDEIGHVAERNRRLGLGLMGLHEFCLLNGQRYEWTSQLDRWASMWAQVATDEGKRYADVIGGNHPITTRAIAPTGTISIIGETTSGIEPVFCNAYKRRYIDAGVFKYQYVIDPTVRRLIDQGVRPDQIEDAYALSLDIPRRLAMQAGMQQYVDQAISSTINLPSTSSPHSPTVDQFAAWMQQYLPSLKGITVYPNEARPGQPIVPVSIDEAMGEEGKVYEEDADRCLNGVCGL